MGCSGSKEEARRSRSPRGSWGKHHPATMPSRKVLRPEPCSKQEGPTRDSTPRRGRRERGAEAAEISPHPRIFSAFSRGDAPFLLPVQRRWRGVDTTYSFKTSGLPTAGDRTLRTWYRIDCELQHVLRVRAIEDAIVPPQPPTCSRWGCLC
ncbi:unnamed protein product, partial [Scytosiphon promiscuus]